MRKPRSDLEGLEKSIAQHCNAGRGATLNFIPAGGNWGPSGYGGRIAFVPKRL